MPNHTATSSQASSAGRTVDLESQASASATNFSNRPEASSREFNGSTLEFSMDSTQAFSDHPSLATTQYFPPNDSSFASTMLFPDDSSFASTMLFPEDPSVATTQVIQDDSFESQTQSYASTMAFSDQTSFVSSQARPDHSMSIAQASPDASVPEGLSERVPIHHLQLPPSSGNTDESASSILEDLTANLDVSMQTVAPSVVSAPARRNRTPKPRRNQRRIQDPQAMDVSMMSASSVGSAVVAPPGAPQQQRLQVQPQPQEVPRSTQVTNVVPSQNLQIVQQQNQPTMMNPQAARLTLGPGRQILPPTRQWTVPPQWTAQQQPPALEPAFRAPQTVPAIQASSFSSQQPVPAPQAAPILTQDVIASAYAQGFAEAQRSLAAARRQQEQGSTPARASVPVPAAIPPVSAPVTPGMPESPPVVQRARSVPPQVNQRPARTSLTAAEHAANEERLAIQRMTAWIEKSMQKYGNMNPVRVFPTEAPSRAAWSVQQAREFIDQAQDTLKKVTQEDSWLSAFQAKRIFFPQQMSPELFQIPLDNLPQHERGAVLQSLLEATGYSFVNLVSTWYENPKLQGRPDVEILIEATILRDYLNQEVAVWTNAQRHPGSGPQVSSNEVVIALRRQAPATISSIHDSNAQESRHVLSVDGAILDSPMSRLSRESARAAAIVMTGQGDPSPDQVLDEDDLEDAQTPVQMSPARQNQAEYAREGYSAPARDTRPLSPRFEPQDAAPSLRDPYATSTFAPNAFSQYGPSYFGTSTLPGGTGGIPVSLGALQTQPNIQRVFIPQQAIPTFDGLGTAADRQRWLKQYLYVATYGGWTDAEKCSHLEIYFRGAAESWLLQLGRSTRRVWKDLERAFAQEFCTARGTAFERYYMMRQSKSESALNYLWRLNVAARSAKVPFHTYEGLKSHVTRFILTLMDENTRRSLTGRTFNSVGELEETLKNLQDHLQTPRHDSWPSNKSRDTPFSGHSKDRRALTNARVYLAQNDPGESRICDNFAASCGDTPRVHFSATTEFSLGEDDGDGYQSSWSEDEVEAAEVYRADSRNPQGRSETRVRRDGPQQPPGNPRSNLRRPDEHPGAKRDIKCESCGRKSHSTEDCWSQVTCNDCGSLGHPSEVCWKKCDACKKIHDRGQCELKKVMEDLKKWYRAEGSPAELPPSVLKQLDAMHLNF